MNRVAIITGAGRGIGRAAAIELDRRGWTCALVSRTTAELGETSKLLGARPMTLPLDVAARETSQLAVERVAAELGRIDAVVNCAGLAPLRPFEETDDATLESVLNVNLVAAFRLARAAWPHLVASKGTIVNISSLAAIDPFVGFSAYAAAKAGLEGLTIALAKEGAPHGVRCVAVAPGGVETAMFRALPGAADVPAEALLTSVEVAAVIADCITTPLRYASGDVIRLRKVR